MRMLVADRGTGEPISLGAALLAGKKVAPDVTGLLMEDHRTVLGWFAWYDQVADRATKDALAQKICAALRAHMAAEEAVFYPQVQRATGDKKLVKRAIKEHEGAKRLIEAIEAGTDPAAQAATMATLHTEILAHVEEEEEELFPKVRASDLDLYAVGRAVAAHRADRLFELCGNTAGAATLEEIAPMPIAQEEARRFFILGLKNAHAAAQQARSLVSAQADRVENYPQLRAKLESHLMEKDAQLERLETMLDDCGESRSMLKDSAGALMAGFSSMTAAAAEDEIIKSSFATLSLAKFEAASLETLILFAEAAGQTQALRPLQQSLSEERAIAAFIEENLRPTAIRFLQLHSEGLQASH